MYRQLIVMFAIIKAAEISNKMRSKNWAYRLFHGKNIIKIKQLIVTPTNKLLLLSLTSVEKKILKWRNKVKLFEYAAQTKALKYLV